MTEDQKIPTYADYVRIEQEARVLRAQAMNEGLKAIGSAFVSLPTRFAGLFRKAAHI